MLFNVIYIRTECNTNKQNVYFHKNEKYPQKITSNRRSISQIPTASYIDLRSRDRGESGVLRLTPMARSIILKSQYHRQKAKN